ncbi:globin domain-containing protein [Streptomyces sp. 6N223]|uniref:globin domain-containing protein n=1 Tax=Streptomyces sp. 6N223 TaxID=3457412 RepID=UPI003FD4D0A2
MTAISADDGAATTGEGQAGGARRGKAMGAGDGLGTGAGRGRGMGTGRGSGAGMAGEAAAAAAPAPHPHPAQAPVPPTGLAGSAATGRGGSAASRQPSRDAVIIRRTLAEIEPVADHATSYFYALLFLNNPGLREMFPAAMDAQRDRLFAALLTAAERIDDTVRLVEYLNDLGRGHRKYGTRPEHYPAVGECLMSALERYAPRSWGPDAEAAWVRAYTVISQTMIDAAADDELRAPPWWHAEIINHERRTAEIAVLTLRTDQPYPYRAGQYAAVETPWWPRVWRYYSFAGAPRSDGLLTFHVKAVPAGWVSRSLVHRARRGDVVRLGPPSGSMTVDHASGSGLVCVGGSTGIAPIKALVEDVAEFGRRRPVEVFFGANREAELYALEEFHDLERRHPWLSVRPVVAEYAAEYAARGFAGRLPDAVRKFGPWAGWEGYLSGPPGMVRSGVDAMISSGIPAERIRHDFTGTLTA